MPVTFTSRATRDLAKLPESDREAIVAKLVRFAETGEGDVRRLTGWKVATWRLRHGNWRALFERDGAVIVVRVLHRREAND